MSEQRERLRPILEPLALGLTLLGAFARVVPHPPNFAPVGGMGLFAGSRIKGWQAYLVPLLLMAVTDPLLSALYGFPAFSSRTPFIYGSLLVTVWIGRRWLRSPNVRRIALTAFLCSLQFFLVTNAAEWLLGNMYPHTAAGLVACYMAAIPFFGNTLASDLLYSGLFFGLYASARRMVLGNWSLAEKTAA